MSSHAAVADTRTRLDPPPSPPLGKHERRSISSARPAGPVRNAHAGAAGIGTAAAAATAAAPRMQPHPHPNNRRGPPAAAAMAGGPSLTAVAPQQQRRRLSVPQQPPPPSGGPSRRVRPRNRGGTHVRPRLRRGANEGAQGGWGCDVLLPAAASDFAMWRGKGEVVGRARGAVDSQGCDARRAVRQAVAQHRLQRNRRARRVARVRRAMPRPKRAWPRNSGSRAEPGRPPRSVPVAAVARAPAGAATRAWEGSRHGGSVARWVRRRRLRWRGWRG